MLSKINSPKQRIAHVSQIANVLDTVEEAASLVAVSCFLREGASGGPSVTSSRLVRSPALALPTCARVPSRSAPSSRKLEFDGARLTRVGAAAPTSGVGETHEDRRRLGCPLSDMDPP